MECVFVFFCVAQERHEIQIDDGKQALNSESAAEGYVVLLKSFALIDTLFSSLLFFFDCIYFFCIIHINFRPISTIILCLVVPQSYNLYTPLVSCAVIGNLADKSPERQISKIEINQILCTAKLQSPS
jgi:hypothetical protein